MKKQRQVLNPAERKLKKIITSARVLIAFTIIVLILLAVAFVASFIDKRTPQIVYFIGIILLAGIEAVLGNACSWYSKKLKKELGIVGNAEDKKNLVRHSAVDYPLKDKVYKILTCIGFIGDVLLIISVVFLMREAKIPAEVTVISILLGALIATVFHITATVRFFRRKAKAEKFPLINGNNSAA